MSHPTTRVLALLEILQTYPGLTGAELADRLGVDQRTVRRYALRLDELGIPVEARRGRFGGYRLRPGYKLPPLLFTDSEAVAIVLGLLAARRLGVATVDDAAAAALAKVQRVVPEEVRRRTIALEQSLEFTHVAGAAASPQTSVLLGLGQAVAQHQRVRVTYRSWRGQASDRELDPYGLIFHSGRWYVNGYDHHRGRLRNFRLDRIGEITTTSATFQAPDDFDPVAHLVESLAAVPYRWQVEVQLDTTMEEARAVLPRSVAELVPNSAGVLLKVRAENLDGTARMLAGIGFGFTVKRPPELREAVSALAERLRGYVAIETEETD